MRRICRNESKLRFGFVALLVVLLLPAQSFAQSAVFGLDEIAEFEVPSVLATAYDPNRALLKRIMRSHEAQAISQQAFQKSLENAPVPKARPIPAAYRPLSDDDARRYRKIFAYQSEGQWKKADAEIVKLTNLSLRGHVLYQRYIHPTAYRSRFQELSDWMEMYAGHPGAIDIYNLALKRMPKGTKHVTQPSKAKGIGRGSLENYGWYAKRYKSSKRRSRAQNDDIKTLRNRVSRDVRRGAPTRAWRRMNESRATAYMDQVEFDTLRARIAQGYLNANKTEKAFAFASESANRSGLDAPLAGWIAGLAGWKLGHYPEAAKYFEMTALSRRASSWTISAGAYWASRAHLKSANYSQVSKWLKRAAAHPRTFYGLIAIRALGKSFDFNWVVPTFNENHKAVLAGNASGRRAMVLVDAGQYHLAEAELRRIHPGRNNGLREALIAYGQHANLPAYSMRFANAVSDPNGGLYDAALYPVAAWEPENGYKVDKALIHAYVRQESRFDPKAHNPSGATGLMQIMPSTANYISRSKRYGGRMGRHRLEDPRDNLALGQRYIQSLLRQNYIDGDLFNLAIAYNAGPGNLRRWQREYRQADYDPLLFVESIPSAETRAFVERVMTNYWIYRLRLHQHTPSLDAVASGKAPVYAALDDSSYQVAKAGP